MTRVAATGKMNRHVAWVRSMSDPDKEYQLVRRPNGDLKCSCMAWAFDQAHDPKWCRHIGVLGIGPAGQPQAVTVDVTRHGDEHYVETGGERYAVRAISFDARV